MGELDIMNKKQKHDRCPKCNSEKLDYWDDGKEPKEFTILDYTCEGCGFKGRAWYKIWCNAESVKQEKSFVFYYHTDDKDRKLDT